MTWSVYSLDGYLSPMLLSNIRLKHMQQIYIKVVFMSLNDHIIQAPKLYYYNVHNVSIKGLYGSLNTLWSPGWVILLVMKGSKPADVTYIKL